MRKASDNVSAVAGVLSTLYEQQGNKLVGTGTTQSLFEGTAVSLSRDGSTLAVASTPGAFVFITVDGGSSWIQQAGPLIVTGATGTFANAAGGIALSGDGNTLAIGEPGDNGNIGACWTYVRTQAIWMQQAGPLVGTGFTGQQFQGSAVALSDDGRTLASGAFFANSGAGCCWIFVQDSAPGVWAQQGTYLVGTGATGAAQQGFSVALSADGNTLAEGGPQDNSTVGAVWTFLRTQGSATPWTQFGTKLIPNDYVNAGGSGVSIGSSVSLSADGLTLAFGGDVDNAGIGAAWAWTRTQSGSWIQQGSKLIGDDSVPGNFGGGAQGSAVALSANGDTLAVGGSNNLGVIAPIGASWLFKRSQASSWTQYGSRLVGTGYVLSGDGVAQGTSIALSGDGLLLAVGGPADWDPVPEVEVGSTWIFRGFRSVTQETDLDLAENSLVNVQSVSGVAQAGFVQQGNKLVGSGYTGFAGQGFSAALSRDGSTLAVGGYQDNSSIGAVFVFATEDGGSTWLQQSGKLVGTGYTVGTQGPFQGFSVALSADGNVLASGAPSDNNIGAVWIFFRTGTAWAQDGAKLVASTFNSTPDMGWSVALSDDGYTLAAGSPTDNGGEGISYIWTQQAGVWSEAAALIGTGGTPPSAQGESVSLSADGITLAVGGSGDNSGVGALWIFSDAAGTGWTQQAGPLVGTGLTGAAALGTSISISADGNTLVAGAASDASGLGSALIWVHDNAGTAWSQQGPKLQGSDVVLTGQPIHQGNSVACSSDGNTVAVAGYFDGTDANDDYNIGAVWIYKRAAGTSSWNQYGSKLVPTGYLDLFPQFGTSVALSGDGLLLAGGGVLDANEVGACWVYRSLETTQTTTLNLQNNQIQNVDQLSTNSLVVAAYPFSQQGTALIWNRCHG